MLMTNNIKTHSVADGTKKRLWTLLAVFVLISMGIVAYSSSFSGAFVFDDTKAIVNNPAVHRILPLSGLFGEGRASRALVVASLKINMALAGVSDTGKPEVFGFHVFNLAVHLLAGLTLFGLVRRTLTTDLLKDAFAEYSTPLALAVALIWMVHPLQTMAVTYIIQRAESMMGLFYLLTLYCAARSFSSSTPGVWIAASVAACFSGLGCKQVIVTVPLMVLIYDRVFVSGTMAKAVRKHWLIYLLLFSLWVPILYMSAGALRPSVHAGFAMKDITVAQYAVSQPGVILHYLRLAFWPAGLCIDYLWPIARTLPEILPPAIIVASLLIACVAALKYRPCLGFVGVWFFLILAPTSSVMPIRDLAVEHRMYLSLAAISALVVGGGFWIAGRLYEKVSVKNPARAASTTTLILACAASVVLAGATYQRNKVYASPEKIWSDVISTRGDNSRAYHNRGIYLESIGKRAQAISDFRRSIWISPNNAEVYHSLGKSFYESGRLDEAIDNFLKAVQLNPAHAQSNSSLTELYRQKGALDEAWSHGQVALANLKPYDRPEDVAGLYLNLGNVRADQGLYEEAIGLYAKSIEIAPDFVVARVNLADVYTRIGQLELAAEQFGLVLQYEPLFKNKAELARVYARFGTVLAKLKKYNESITCFERAIQLNPDLSGAAGWLEHVTQLKSEQVD